MVGFPSLFDCAINEVVKKLTIIVFALFLAFDVLAQSASWVHGMSGRVYKWTDDSGNVHYTQYPPDNRAYEEVDKADVPTAQQGTPDQAGSETAGDGSTSGKGGGVTAEEQNKQNCITANDNLTLLSTPLAEVTYVGADGKTVVVDDKQRAARIEQAKKNIAEYCK